MLSPQFLAKLRSLPTAGELGRIIERGSEKLVHLALCLRRGHVLGWAKRPLPPAVHQYIYGPFKPVECRNRGLAFGGDEDISAKRCACSRESARDRVVAIGQQDRLSGKAAVGDGVGAVTGHPHPSPRFSRSQGQPKTGLKIGGAQGGEKERQDVE